jgi:hypothetical protein
MLKLVMANRFIFLSSLVVATVANAIQQSDGAVVGNRIPYRLSAPFRNQ